MSGFDSRNMQRLRKNRLLSVLDIGSSKTVCLIARLQPLACSEYLPGRTHGIDVLGFGMQKSYGVKAGVVTDMQAMEQSIRLAVDAAERMCGLVVDSVLVNFSSKQQKSHHIEAQVPIKDKVSARDIRRALAQGSRAAFNMERPILHLLPVSFQLDGEKGLDAPLDMAGDLLQADMHVVSAEASALRNLEHCINRAHLGVEAIVSGGLASALCVLVGDEARLGACCIDMGAGTTSLSVFVEDKFVHGETLPLGSHHITLDIARGLSISVEEAERLKVLYGSALAESVGDHHLISMEHPEGAALLPGQYPRAFLSRIIRARTEEILEMARDKLRFCGIGSSPGQRFVLTGGGAQLTGLAEVARRFLGGHVRTGRPLGISGLPEMARGSAFSVAAGLLIYPQAYGFNSLQRDMASGHYGGRDGIDRGSLARVRHWLHAHL